MKLDKQEVIDKINAIGAKMPCARCGHNKFDFVGVSRISINPDADLDNINLSMPIAVVACAKCSVIYQHALVALDLVAAKKKDD